MLNYEAVKVVSLIILWSFGWLQLDELKGVFGNCTYSMCQVGWRLLIKHGKYSMLYVCFDR